MDGAAAEVEGVRVVLHEDDGARQVVVEERAEVQHRVRLPRAHVPPGDAERRPFVDPRPKWRRHPLAGRSLPIGDGDHVRAAAVAREHALKPSEASALRLLAPG